jgi:hypothetical protein
MALLWSLVGCWALGSLVVALGLCRSAAMADACAYRLASSRPKRAYEPPRFVAA